MLMGYLGGRLKIWLVGARNLGGARRKDGVCCHLVVRSSNPARICFPPGNKVKCLEVVLRGEE